MKDTKQITIDQLKTRYYEHNPEGHFFDGKTLKFFGERFSEMRVLKGTVNVTSAGGYEHECYMVSSRQRPGMGLAPKRVYHYFDVETFEHVIV